MYYIVIIPILKCCVDNIYKAELRNYTKMFFYALLCISYLPYDTIFAFNITYDDWFIQFMANLNNETRALSNNSLIDFRFDDIFDVPAHSMRYGFTWEDNYNLVTSAGKKWCGLVRDNWACIGKTYYENLLESPFFNSSLAMFNLKANSMIFGLGNSFLAERIFYWSCETVAEFHKAYRKNMSVQSLHVGVYGTKPSVNSNTLLFFIPYPYNYFFLN